MLNSVFYEVVVESLRKNRVLFRVSSEFQKVLKFKRLFLVFVCFRFIDIYQYMYWVVENISFDIVYSVVLQGVSEQWLNYLDCNKVLNKF